MFLIFSLEYLVLIVPMTTLVSFRTSRSTEVLNLGSGLTVGCNKAGFDLVPPHKYIHVHQGARV